jgi:hypothetical protein
VLGPLIHEFNWGPEDWHKLAAGTVAGHIVECGAQCSGGNFTDWRTIPNLSMVGYPVLEVEPSGDFCVTKHEGTGGLVSVETVTHQLAYEMGNPERYLTPDVIADFTSFRLKADGENRVLVQDTRGLPPTDTFKVSMSYSDGWKSVGQLTISGPDALAKARLCAKIVWDRLAYDGCEYSEEERLEEYVGAGECHAGLPGGTSDSPAEVVLRLGVKGPDRAKVARFGPELVPLVTSGPPGVTGFAGGRPKAQEIIGYWPALMSKHLIQPTVTVVES